MQDRPTAEELLDALADFMRDRAANARDRWERFQFQVAANSIGILKREAEMEEGLMREEWQRLDSLLGEEPVPGPMSELKIHLTERNERLVASIHAGKFDDGPTDVELQRHLLETVLAKVRIASPNERI